MDKLKLDLVIDDSRNVTFHSLKKTVINFACKELKDFDAAKRQGNHTAATCDKYYIEANTDYSSMPGIVIWKKFNLKKIKEFSQEEMVKILYNCSEGCQREFLSMAEKIVSKINS